MNKKAAILFSGGKDSCLALLKAREKGFNVKYLATILPSSYDSWMWHKPSLLLLKTQAKVLDIPLIIQRSKTEKEKEVKDLEKLFRKIRGKVDYIITGGIGSKYQKTRITKVIEEHDLKSFNPLWNVEAKDIWKECLKNKFEIILTKICCEGLNKEFLGKRIDKEILDIITKKSKKYGFNLEFEGGEAETAVLDMPLFKEKIKISTKVKSESPYRHFLLIKKVKLKKKEKEGEEIKK